MEIIWHRQKCVFTSFGSIKEFVQININDMKEVHYIKKYKNTLSVVSNT